MTARTVLNTLFVRMFVIGCSSLMLLGWFGAQAESAVTVATLNLAGVADGVSLTPADTLCATVQLDAGDNSGHPADWWILMYAPAGWYGYQYPDRWTFVGDGVADLQPTHQGPLADLTHPVEILCLTGLAAGAYYLYFGVDMTMDGRLDAGVAYDWKRFTVSAAHTYAIVDTGQTICYDDSGAIDCPNTGDAFDGQDAQISGNTPDFTDNGDGTVTDHVTGLMWQQSPDTDGDGDIDAADKLTYDQAVAGAGALDLAGYSDWRLPTIKELYSLIDFSGIDPSGFNGSGTYGLVPFIDTRYFDFAYGDTNAGERIIDAQYASASKYVSTTMNGDETLFGVNFADGRIKGYGMSLFGNAKTFFVIYVRGNAAYGQNDFVDNGDGTITDHATGLMWSQNDSGAALTWEQALAWVNTQNAANYLGYADWRLPNVKALQGIVDYTRSPDTSASAAIDPLFNVTPIVNEAGQTDYPCYWSGTTHANWSAAAGKFGAYVAFGRAMGYMNGRWLDVHGAGAQRSDPKSGDPADYPTGHGPQGDAIRIYNYVRMARDQM